MRLLAHPIGIKVEAHEVQFGRLTVSVDSAVDGAVAEGALWPWFIGFFGPICPHGLVQSGLWVETAACTFLAL